MKRTKNKDSEAAGVLANYIARWLQRHASEDLRTLCEQDMDDVPFAAELRLLFLHKSAIAMGDKELFADGVLGDPEFVAEDLELCDDVLCLPGTPAATNANIALWPLVMRSAIAVNWKTVADVVTDVPAEAGLQQLRGPKVKQAAEPITNSVTLSKYERE